MRTEIIKEIIEMIETLEKKIGNPTFSSHPIWQDESYSGAVSSYSRKIKEKISQMNSKANKK